MKKLFPIILLFLSSCDKCNQSAQTVVEPVKEIVVNAPAFNSDSVYNYTQAQINFGTREMNSKGHEACAKYLIDEIKKFTDTVYVQKFDVKGFDGVNLKCTNIIGSINPKATNRILLTSHWDSRPWADQDTKEKDKPILSACDGASGVATLIEIARAIKSSPLKNIGVDLFFNDAEDRGYSSSLDGIVKPGDYDSEGSWCLGAQHWSANPHVAGYKADFGILLDMAAAKDAVFSREGISFFNAGWVQDKVWSNASTLGFGNFFSNQTVGSITDDHVYINQGAKIPTIDIIHIDLASPSGTFGSYWHTHADDMSVIDKTTLNAVGKTLLYTIYQYEAEHATQ
ncbi:MAG: M28 family peptidase [Bacteroidetes bacterium]|nr:M28 family peptidase [Bacteroidota bacterium]